jgi:5-formyltetrahydrofolate cyclo-ligase
MLASKLELRHSAKAVVGNFSAMERAAKSALVSQNCRDLIDRLFVDKTVVVGICAPLKEEVILTERILNRPTTNFAFPLLEENFKMQYFEVSPKDCNEIVNSGEVSLGKKFIKTSSIIPDVLLIPGLSFTKQGQRLGRGAGYFDRYLIGYTGLRVGICFQEQIVNFLPTEEHDQDCDYVVTDTNLYSCTRS